FGFSLCFGPNLSPGSRTELLVHSRPSYPNPNIRINITGLDAVAVSVRVPFTSFGWDRGVVGLRCRRPQLQCPNAVPCFE
uniref:Uncharacterized protein n=1 Tax=Cannabis sativa TaxID=3483 RepID=A0A803QRV4_CANSA